MSGHINLDVDRRASLKALLNRGRRLLLDLDNLERKHSYTSPRAKELLESIPSWSSGDADRDARTAQLEDEAHDATRGFAMGQEEHNVKTGVLYRARVWVHDANTWAIANCADPAPIVELPPPPQRLHDGSWDRAELNDEHSDGTPNPWRKWREIIEVFRDSVMQRHAALTAYYGTLDGRRDVQPRDVSGGWPHLRTAGVIEPKMLDTYLEAIGKRTTDAQIGASIAASKNLLEGCLRGWLYEIRDKKEVDKLDLRQLFGAVRKEWLSNESLDRSVGDPSFGVGNMLNGLANAIAGIGEVRNQVGSGHGRTTTPEGLTAAHAVFVADTVYAITALLAAQAADRRPTSPRARPSDEPGL